MAPLLRFLSWASEPGSVGLSTNAKGGALPKLGKHRETYSKGVSEAVFSFSLSAPPPLLYCCYLLFFILVGLTTLVLAMGDDVYLPNSIRCLCALIWPFVSSSLQGKEEGSS